MLLESIVESIQAYETEPFGAGDTPAPTKNDRCWQQLLRIVSPKRFIASSHIRLYNATGT